MDSQITITTKESNIETPLFSVAICVSFIATGGTELQNTLASVGAHGTQLATPCKMQTVAASKSQLACSLCGNMYSALFSRVLFFFLGETR